MNEYEKLLREFIAALEAINDHVCEEGDLDNIICGVDIETYRVNAKLQQLKYQLISLPL